MLPALFCLSVCSDIAQTPRVRCAQKAAVLAHAAYCESGGTASVSVALWSPDGTPPGDLDAWQAAVAAAPEPPDTIQAIHAALAPHGGTMLLRRVPKVHTKDELTTLLEGSADPLAAEFIAARSEKDKAKQKELKVQMAPGGRFAPLLSALAEQVASPPPFTYPGFPSGPGESAALAPYLRSSEFLHFELGAAEAPPELVGVEPEPAAEEKAAAEDEGAEAVVG